MTAVVLYAISPIHVLAQLTALRHAHPQGTARATLLLHWPFAEEAMLAEIAAAVRAMLATAPEIERIRVVPQREVDAALAEPDEAARCAAFARTVGVAAADEIVFAHDVSGSVYQLLAGAFPTARRVTTGENLGHVFERDVYFSYLAAEPPKPKLKHRVKALLGLGPKPAAVAALPAPPVRDRAPEIARLLLPIDQSGRYLDGMALDVPPRALARRVLADCVASARALGDYVEAEVARIEDRPAFVLCTQNYAEAGSIDFDREIAMWASVVERFCPRGAVLFLKAHPAETLPRTERLAEALGGAYALRRLDPAFRRYPIELWSALVSRATVVSASMPALSLRYLYDVEAIQPFSDAFIAEWFPERLHRYHQNGLSLFTGPLAVYDAWDGRSVLWSGGGR